MANNHGAVLSLVIVNSIIVNSHYVISPYVISPSSTENIELVYFFHTVFLQSVFPAAGLPQYTVIG